MLKKIDHIGIAVEKLDDVIPFYRDVLGFEYLGKETVEREGVNVAFFKIGEVKIELLEPISADSPIYKFIEKKGQGIHHIAYYTDNITQDSEKISQSGLRLLYPDPKPGAHSKLVNFVHPKDSFGVLVELCTVKQEEKKEN